MLLNVTLHFCLYGSVSGQSSQRQTPYQRWLGTNWVDTNPEEIEEEEEPQARRPHPLAHVLPTPHRA
jgi:hypothetical protein